MPKHLIIILSIKMPEDATMLSLYHLNYVMHNFLKKERKKKKKKKKIAFICSINFAFALNISNILFVQTVFATNTIVFVYTTNYQTFFYTHLHIQRARERVSKEDGNRQANRQKGSAKPPQQNL